jgi:hypothetical protein
MTANQREAPPSADMPLYGDQDTEIASGVPLPSLRVLQAAGAIRSDKAPKYHGGFRRMWPEQDVLKAALAAALGEHFAWNIRLVATAMAKVQPALWNTLIEVALIETEKGDPKSPQPTLLMASELDWYAELIDRKFLFFQIPELFTDVLPGAAAGQTSLLLGMVAKDTFAGISWELATPRGRKVVRQALGDESGRKAMLTYKLAMASHGSFLSKATINLSLQVRAAWRRLHGLESRFVQETIPLARRQPDQ